MASRLTQFFALLHSAQTAELDGQDINVMHKTGPGTAPQFSMQVQETEKEHSKISTIWILLSFPLSRLRFGILDFGSPAHEAETPGEAWGTHAVPGARVSGREFPGEK